MEKAVFGIAKTESQAISIADQLKAAGFSENDISVLFPDQPELATLLMNNIRRHLKAPRPEPVAVPCWVVPWAG